MAKKVKAEKISKTCVREAVQGALKDKKLGVRRAFCAAGQLEGGSKIGPEKMAELAQEFVQDQLNKEVETIVCQIHSGGRISTLICASPESMVVMAEKIKNRARETFMEAIKESGASPSVADLLSRIGTF